NYDVANIRFDPSRIPAYVISGIGFLGAGTIIVYGGTIRGLTTAASIWIVAGLGLIGGIGMYSIAGFTTFIILLSLSLLNNFEKFIFKKKATRQISIIASEDFTLSHLMSIIESFDLGVDYITTELIENGHKHISISLKPYPDVNFNHFLDEITHIEEIKKVVRK